MTPLRVIYINKFSIFFNLSTQQAQSTLKRKNLLPLAANSFLLK